MTNVRVNLALEELIVGGGPAWEHLYWLLTASAGLAALCLLPALRDSRRYALLLLLVAVVLLVHAPQANKQYRFVFAVVPLYLMVGADVLARLATRAPAGRRRLGRLARPAALALACAFAAVSAGGILNALPSQAAVYGWRIGPTGRVAFLRDHDPVFSAYRYLAGAPGVAGVWHVDRAYYDLPGYYHLHRAVPFYDANTGRESFSDDGQFQLEAIAASVSHIVTADSATAVPGYSVERTFGPIRVLRRDARDAPVRGWERYAPTIAGGVFTDLVRRLYPGAPAPPPNSGIRFVDGDAEGR